VHLNYVASRYKLTLKTWRKRDRNVEALEEGAAFPFAVPVWATHVEQYFNIGQGAIS
jgi:hypothetical protein